jgi:hypothetical protein
MKRMLRFTALTAALALTTWLGSARTSHAASCDSLTYPCTVGTIVTCDEGDLSYCKCVNAAGRGVWLCYF